MILTITRQHNAKPATLYLVTGNVASYGNQLNKREVFGAS